MPRKKSSKPSLIIPNEDKITVLSPEQQEAMGVNIKDLVSKEQLKHIANEPVVIIRHEGSETRRKSSIAGPSSAKISIIGDGPSTRGTKLLNLIPHVDPKTVDIANTEIMISLPESTTISVNVSCTSSKRGRPNKFIALQNGDIVQQVLPKPVKKEVGKSATLKRVGRKRNKSESDASLSEEDAPATGRKSSRKSAGKSAHYKEFEESSSEDDEKTINLPGVTIKKVGRPSNLKRKTEDTAEQVEEADTFTLTAKPKRGRRKSDKPAKILYDEQNLSLTSEDNLCIVTCGACDVEMPLKKYHIHRISTHHGLSWIKGNENPLDFYDSSAKNLNFLGNMIREAFIAIGRKNPITKKIVLPCQTCKKACNSYMGYLSHFTFCNISAEEHSKRMYQCLLCDKKMFPSSRYYHDTHHTKMEEEVVLPPEFVDVEAPRKRAAAVKARSYMKDYDTEDSKESVTFRIVEKENKKGIVGKRKGWTKALTVGPLRCKYVGCEFTTTDIESYEDHITGSCPLTSETFICNECDCKFTSEAAVTEHFNANHIKQEKEEPEEELYVGVEHVEPEEEYLEPEEELKKSKSRKSQPAKLLPSTLDGALNINIPNSLNCLSQSKPAKGNVPYKVTLLYTLKFCCENFSTNILYPRLFDAPQFEPLANSDHYLPLAEQSILFTLASTVKPKINVNFVKQASWQSLKRLEGTCDNGVPTFFAGGPILSLAWCPTPTTQILHEQLLAVSCHKSMDSKLGFQGILPQNSSIQVWSAGLLSNSTDQPEVPKLLCVLGHKWGIIRQMVWCPSGSYDPDTGKLGLLAAACADGTVRIIPICRQDSGETLLNAKASKTLIPHSNMDRLNQCICLHWLRGKGHKVIGAGFADGMVCFWNIDLESTLLSNDKGETLPYLTFFAHQGPVSGISMYPHPQARFAVTGGNTEKVLNFWDLEQRGEHSTTHIGRKGKITKIEWPLCWPSVLTSYEEQGSAVLAAAPRNFIHQSNMLPQNSSTSDVSNSDWLNYVGQSTGAGEVTIIANNQMLFGMDVDKAMKDRRALVTRTAVSDSVISLHENGNVDCNDPTDLYYANYGEVSGRGLVFCDIHLDSDKRWPPMSEIACLSDRMEQCCSANYPVTSVNRLAWNPNACSFGWMAVGYQIGLVRLVRIKTKTSDDSLKTYMSS